LIGPLFLFHHEAFKHIREGIVIAEQSYREDPSEKADKFTGVSDAYEALGLAFSRQARLPNTVQSRVEIWKQARDLSEERGCHRGGEKSSRTGSLKNLLVANWN
jgi:hypothetical protein